MPVTWHRIASVKEATPIPSGVWWWMKKRIRSLADFSIDESMLGASISALTLTAGWQKGHLAHKYSCHISKKVPFWNKWKKTHVHRQNNCGNGCGSVITDHSQLNSQTKAVLIQQQAAIKRTVTAKNHQTRVNNNWYLTRQICEKYQCTYKNGLQKFSAYHTSYWDSGCFMLSKMRKMILKMSFHQWGKNVSP